MATTKRIYYLDWLRVLAFWLLISFHSWQPFNHFHWLIKSDQQYVLVDLMTIYTHGWRLYLIFFVSGVGTWFAMRSHRKWLAFFIDRLKRLIVPFVFASVLIIPIQRFYQWISDGIISNDFIGFTLDYPLILLNKELGGTGLTWLKEIGIHLWYLPYLLLMTVVLYWFFIKVQNNRVQLNDINRILEKQYGLFILAIPLFLFRLLLKPMFPLYTDLADFLTYIWLFLYGFVFMNNHEYYLEIVRKNQGKLLRVGILCSSFLLVGSSYERLVTTYLNPEFNSYHLLISFLTSLIAVSWSFYFVAVFSTKLNFNNKYLSEANRSILPIYVLHQSIIIMIGYYVFKYDFGGFFEFLVIATATTLFSILFYLIIKRFKLLRLVFGMK